MPLPLPRSRQVHYSRIVCDAPNPDHTCQQCGAEYGTTVWAVYHGADATPDGLLSLRRCSANMGHRPPRTIRGV